MAEPLIWLPLNGDFRNNGLGTMSTIPSGTFVSNGKCGKALNLNASISNNAFTVSELTGCKVFTIAYWYYQESIETDWATYINLYGSSSSG